MSWVRENHQHTPRRSGTTIRQTGPGQEQNRLSPESLFITRVCLSWTKVEGSFYGITKIRVSQIQGSAYNHILDGFTRFILTRLIKLLTGCLQVFQASIRFFA